MALYYYQNKALWQEKNAAGLDYTPAYIKNMLFFMGATGTPCAPDEVANLTEKDVLLIGAETIEVIPQNVGTVILLGTEIGKVSVTAKREKKIFADLALDGSLIPLFVPVSEATEGEVLYSAKLSDGTVVPAILKRGEAVYDFRFDVAATVWFSGDGFLPDHPSHGFPVRRTSNARPLPDDRHAAEPYNDLLLLYLEKLLRKAGVAMIGKLPPTEDGRVPDFTFNISGDDDNGPGFIDLSGAKTVQSFGIPYHINMMPFRDGSFSLTPDEIKDLNALGCEIALHTDYHTHPDVYPYTAEGQAKSCEVYEKWFGVPSVTNVNHCLVQDGTAAERLRWLSDNGILADNGKSGDEDPADINAFNACGFGYGTTFPRFTLDDAEHGNKWLLCAEIPITYYEPRLGGDRYTDPDKITRYIDEAAENGRMAQFFFHPHYMSEHPDNFDYAQPNVPLAKAALAHAKQHWEQKGYRPLFTTTDNIAKFWHARAAATVENTADGYTVRCDAACVLVLPTPAATVTVDGKEVAVTVKTIAGETQYLVPLTAGNHTVSIG